MNEPVFGIILGGARHNVVVSPSMAKSVYAFRDTSSSPLINRIMENVFGDSGTIRGMDPAELNVLHQNVFNLFLREPFITEASMATVRRIQRQTPNLVTFSRSVVDQVPWERSSNVTMDPNSDLPICEASLFSLVRNFAAQISTAGFMGEAIFEAFPNLLDDLWILDSQFMNMSKGAPRWLTPGLSTAYRARDRLLEDLAVFHAAFVAWDDGRDPGVKFRDLDDVSEPIKQRIRGLHKMGATAAASAPAHLSFLWAMVGNTTNIIFWNLLRVYAEPSLLEEVRKELAPYVKAHRPSREETGFPIQEQAQLTIDPEGLFNSCHLLKASFYESMRLDSAGLSFRELSSDLTLTESQDDAAIDGLKKPRSYKISKGESIAIPLGVLQNDTRFFSNPTQYDPLRFITRDPETGVKRAEMHSIKPFGSGISGCKGRILAERENLAYVAAILSLWDIQPTRGTQLKVPEHGSSTGTFLPSKNIRVTVQCRV